MSRPTAKRSPERSDGVQTSLLPIPCPCGEYPVSDGAEIFNWCRCPKLVSFETAQEWNDWAQAPEEA